MKLLNKKQLLFLSTAMFFAACGDETTQVVQDNLILVSSTKELPKCTKDNEGAEAFVKGETSERICIDGKWTALASSKKDTVVVKDTVIIKDKSSCTTKELKDKSGVKIVCNGDSVGVVLNGKNGKDGATGAAGKDGKNGSSCSVVTLADNSGLKVICGSDSVGVVLNGKQGEKGDPGTPGKQGEKGDTGAGCTIAQDTSKITITCGDKSSTINLSDIGTSIADTAVVDTEKVAISLDSLAGYTQKGPFIKGSTVYLYELMDGRSLKQTNGNFTSNITRDDGRFKFSARDLVSQYVMLLVDGNYRNEVTGNISNGAIKLKAYSDMRRHATGTVNVNILTHLEFDRVYYLVTHEKMTMKEAKRQAQQEIRKQFHINLSDNTDAEDLDVFGKTDADAALLAISILLQGDRSEADLTSLLTGFSDNISKDGTWDDSTTKKQIAAWALKNDIENKLATYRNNVKNWKIGTVPNFEKFIRQYAGVENGLGVCGSNNIPVGTVKNVKNTKSEYYASSYTSTTDKGGATRFICVDTDSAKWRIATNIEKDTMGWGHNFKDGDIRNGQINTTTTYVYQNKVWRLGTNLDSLLVLAGEKACLTAGDTSKVKYNDVYYVCTANTDGAVQGWKKAPDIYNDTYESRSECKAKGLYGDGTLLKGRVNTSKTYACDNSEFRVANNTEISWNKGCVSYIRDTSVIFKGQYSYYKCSDEGWVYDFANLNTGSIKDSRDGKTYKTVGIKTQMWMAENLNFDYKVDNSSASCIPSLSGFGNWIAFHDKFGIGTKMDPDSGSSPLFYGNDGLVHVEASMEIGPEPEWSAAAAEAGTLKYPSAGIALYFSKDKKGVDFKALGIEFLRVTMKASGPIRMAILNEKTAEESAEPGVYIPTGSYITNTYSLTPCDFGFLGTATNCKSDNTINILDWVNKKIAPTGAEILSAVTGLKWEIKDAKGGIGTISIKSIEFLDADGKIIPPQSITNVAIECYNTYTYTDGGKVYGRYYTWAAAMDGAGVYSENSKGCGYGKTCTVKAPVRGICPEGWHIPTKTEWETLYTAIGRSPYAMQSKGAWTNPKDDYGFSALPAGNYSGEEINTNTVGSNAAFWSATEYNNDGAYYWNLDANSASISQKGKYGGHSVRCVKDSE